MSPLKSLKLVALDIDGVALADTFSPIIYRLTEKWGKAYTREVERNVFSQSRNDAANFLIRHFHLPYSTRELIDIYFRERDLYLLQHPNKCADGLLEFLEMLRSLDLKIVCYGGLDKSHFEKELRDFTGYFDGEKYVCTNDIRPGIKEIVKDYYKLEYSNVLFIDDVNKVAEEAKFLGVPFIGVPSGFEHGFQRQDMLNLGVKYIVDAVGKIDDIMIKAIDLDVSGGSFWSD